MIHRYEVILSAQAQRVLHVDFPEKIATAVIEFILGPLREKPHRVGKQLRPPMDAFYSARRGQYRVIYRIVEERILVQVISISHRRDAYRT